MFSEKDYVDALKFCKEQNYPLNNLGVVTRIRPRTSDNNLCNIVEVVRLSTFLREEMREYCSSCSGMYRVGDEGSEHSCCEMDEDGDVDLKFYTKIGDVVLLGRDNTRTSHPYAIVQNIRYEMMLENLKRAKNKVFGNIVENQQQK